MLSLGKGFFSVLCVVNVVFSVVILGVVYVNRFNLFGLHWVFWLIAGYGFVVTPFMIFRLVSAYLYKPLVVCQYTILFMILLLSVLSIWLRGFSCKKTFNYLWI